MLLRIAWFSLGLMSFESSLISAGVPSAPSPMILVKSGIYESFVLERLSREALPQVVRAAIPAFEIEQTPVTNAQFLQFVKDHRSWQRDNVSSLFAEDSYLRSWESSLNPGTNAPSSSPVVSISWFAARAYCRALGRRLPSTYEWEYVASPSFYGSADRDKIMQQILAWYAQPTPERLGPVASKSSHQLGIQDLHGLIWEWTSDFSSVIASGEAREDSSADEGMFCGAGALGGKDPSAYATYMRFAFRSSLKGGYSLAHLGFRCALSREP